MDERWKPVLKSWLEFKEEVGAVFLTPTDAEVWKGTEKQCPYFNKYQKENVVVVHSHPPSKDRKYSPPSPRDFVNCIVSPNPHIVVAQEGFWIYSPTSALKKEWQTLDSQQQDKLSDIIKNNCHGLLASLIGGEMLETFVEGVPRREIDVEQFIEQISHLVPRKDTSLPALGFNLSLQQELPNTASFERSASISTHVWNIENLELLNNRISDTSSGTCVTSDGSYVAF
jgi:hypothetical protein